MTTPKHTPTEKIRAYAAQFKQGLAAYIPDEVQRCEALAAIDDFERLAIEAAAGALAERQVVAIEKIAAAFDEGVLVQVVDIQQPAINSLVAARG